MTKTRQQDPVTTMLLDRWQAASGKLAQLAEEIPEGKFDATLVAGARTPAEVLRHVAFWNDYVARRLKGQPADDSANELPRAQYSTKATILTALGESSGAVTAALAGPGSTPPAEALGLVVPFLEHLCEHYGQLVSYARLLHIVPPASRG